MTFLTAAQSAAIRLIGKKPATFFSSTDKFAMEICDLANEVVSDIVKAHEWRNLISLQVMTGDGATVGFDLPSDYDRMPIKAAVYRPQWNMWHYEAARDLDQWRDLINGEPTPSPGYWFILNGQMQFQPPLTDAAQFYYIGSNAVADTGGAPKAAFTADNDTVRFVQNAGQGERLITLGLIWRWRAQKRLEYAEDMSSYEILLSQLTGTDRGSRIFAEGRAHMPGDVRSAYPRQLG